uniref:Phospholipase D3 n=1 Tax=Aceria tosichella TaxID=561515 RepID=A0A6G1SHI7_9ACAR
MVRLNIVIAAQLVIQLTILASLSTALDSPSQECLPRDSTTAEQCKYQIVQSMPEGLDLPDPSGATTVPTHQALIDMANQAKESLSVASFYWWLTAPKKFDGHPSVEPGRQLMAAIKAASDRGVRVEVVLDHSGRKDMNNPDDLVALKQFSQVKFLNMTRLLRAGVVHTKFMIADNKTAYVGSSNFDWRSYTQIKEIGIALINCPQLVQDLDKIFRTYKLMADLKELPSELSDDFKTNLNMANPFQLDDIQLFMGAAPPAFNAGPNGSYTTGRTDDITGLLHVIDRARHHIDISVMNYSPRFEFGWPRKYWPRIDDALRRAAIERQVRVRLLFSNWTDTKPLEPVWYRSLNAIQSRALRGGGIHVKFFRVPAFDEFQKSIPFARVKHDKYMVTERDLYIGTSNWTPDYFTSTCGVGVVIQPASVSCGRSNSSSSSSSSVSGGNGTTSRDGPSSSPAAAVSAAVASAPPTPAVVKAMQAIFERDFNSQYAHDLDQDP